MVCYISSYLYHVLLTATLEVVLPSVSIVEGYFSPVQLNIPDSCTVEYMYNYGHIVIALRYYSVHYKVNNVSINPEIFIDAACS